MNLKTLKRSIYKKTSKNVNNFILNNKFSFLSFIYLIIISSYILYSSSFYPSIIAPDDFFFYLKTASNLWEYGFATFDGINPTNGIHPLYFIFTSTIYFFTNFAGIDDPTIEFIIFSTVYIIFIYLICNYLVGTRKSLLLYSSLFITSFFMESILLGLMICMFYKTRRSFFIFIIGITRIDSLIILSPLIIEKYYSNKKLFFEYLCYLLLSVFCTFGFNYNLDGFIMSISSFSKITSDLSIYERFLLNMSSNLLVSKIFVTSIMVVFSYKYLYESRNKIGLMLLLGLIIFTLIHLSLSVFRIWYLAPLFIFSSFIILTTPRQSKISSNFIIMVVAFYLIHSIYHDVVFYKKDRDISQVYMSKLKDYKKHIGYKVDQSGYTSYFSDGKIINGDGLINSFEYHRYKKNNLKGYFEKYGYPDYILDNDMLKQDINIKNFYSKNYCISWTSQVGNMMVYNIYEKC